MKYFWRSSLNSMEYMHVPSKDLSAYYHGWGEGGGERGWGEGVGRGGRGISEYTRVGQ